MRIDEGPDDDESASLQRDSLSKEAVLAQQETERSDHDAPDLHAGGAANETLRILNIRQATCIDFLVSHIKANYCWDYACEVALRKSEVLHH